MRLIDADALIQKRNHAKAYAPDMYVIGQGYVMDAPTIDVAPVVRGEWIESDNYKGWLVCSACHDCYVDNAWVNGKKWPYCPNCGAKMEYKPCG